MSATVAVGQPTQQHPSVYPCQVSVNGGAQQPVAVVVSDTALATIPTSEQSAYIQARAVLAVGDVEDATAVVTPLAAGSAAPDPQTSPPTPDTRNWAALWLAGQIPS